MNDDRCCMDCKHYFRIAGMFSHCRRYPPLHKEPTGGDSFPHIDPKTAHQIYCGEYEFIQKSYLDGRKG